MKLIHEHSNKVREEYESLGKAAEEGFEEAGEKKAIRSTGSMEKAYAAAKLIEEKKGDTCKGDRRELLSRRSLLIQKYGG
jgi:hypothetical protein